MNLATSTDIDPLILPRRNRELVPGQTYIMKGLKSEVALETYHLILAPSFMCNLKCRHCYLPDHHVHTLPRESVLRLIDEWSEIVVTERGSYGGIFHLKGGEPLALPYLV